MITHTHAINQAAISLSKANIDFTYSYFENSYFIYVNDDFVCEVESLYEVKLIALALLLATRVSVPNVTSEEVTNDTTISPLVLLY